MQIQPVPATMASPKWLITLDCDEERKLSDDEIARIAENCAGTSWDLEARRYRLNGRGFGPSIHGKIEITRTGDHLSVILHLDQIS